MTNPPTGSWFFFWDFMPPRCSEMAFPASFHKILIRSKKQILTENLLWAWNQAQQIFWEPEIRLSLSRLHPWCRLGRRIMGANFNLNGQFFQILCKFLVGSFFLCHPVIRAPDAISFILKWSDAWWNRKDRETLVLTEFTVGIHRLVYICQANMSLKIHHSC